MQPLYYYITMSHIQQLPKDPSYSSHEQIIQQKWFNGNLYDNIIKSLEKTHNKNLYMIDGPPFVSGTLHYGSALQSFIKSTIFTIASLSSIKQPSRHCSASVFCGGNLSGKLFVIV